MQSLVFLALFAINFVVAQKIESKDCEIPERQNLPAPGLFKLIAMVFLKLNIFRNLKTKSA